MLVIARVNQVITNNITSEDVTKYKLLRSEQYESGDSADIRYEIDLQKRTIVKYVDYYDSKGKVVLKNSKEFEQTLGNKYNKAVKECMNTIINNWKSNGNTKEKGYCTLVVKGKKIYFHDEKMMETLLNIIE